MNAHFDHAAQPGLKSVNAIAGHFFVPSYQRGYRWGRHEVEALLNDIYGCGDLQTGVKYCLQPIVVKKRIAIADGAREGLPAPGELYYELIDGQQRLTTLYLIYLHLQELDASAPPFTLAYQTRPDSTSYLRKPDQARCEDNIDFFHIYGAYHCITQWFADTAKRTEGGQVRHVAHAFATYLRERVHIIWYDAGKQDAIKLFTRLNVGRIALTNAELVKALLLAGQADAPADRYRQIEIATQWDMIEQALQDETFWCFLTNRPTADYPARIELLFDLLANKQATSKDRFFTFEYFKARLRAQAGSATARARGADEEDQQGQLAVWAPVLALYYLLREWFEDRDLYHKIGYLVAARVELAELVAEATGPEPLTKSGFHRFLDARITKRLDLTQADARSLEYEQGYDRCERLLLLFNVESVRLLSHSSERYPFASHKRERWSLEHIHAQNAEPLKKKEEWRAWLSSAVLALQALDRLDSLTKEQAKASLIDDIQRVLASDMEHVKREHFESLARQVMDGFLNAPGTQAADEHSIANLALLSGKANSALNNAAFQMKRLRIMQMDQQGEFIPICTRRVFLKYYAPASSQQMHLWSRTDRDAYLDAMLGKLDHHGSPRDGVVTKYLKKPTQETPA